MNHERKLYVVSRPNMDLAAITSFLADAGLSWRRSADASEAEEIVEVAGRVCYLSFGSNQSPRSTGAYIRNLVIQGHESVLEHISWSFILTGVSRGFSHQLVRHRAGFSFSQLSQQYHDESAAGVIVPEAVQSSPGALEIWNRVTSEARAGYVALLDALLDATTPELSERERLRLVRSAARGVLPAATSTTIFLTANARALRHFLRVRGGIPGDEEMRHISGMLLEAVSVDAPDVFGDFEVVTLNDGSPSVRHTPYA